ncbi:MAG: sigma-54-dependent Fis family transcriptional regulator [Desulfobacteraceae bacterium]|nr:sigma-54-dependent Fis family transcriptional regulator [Desulfobacteraceae bacterium]
MSTPLIGVSKSILKIKELINHVADTCLNVLITGETGVGKEVVAQSLYAESARSSNKFVKINCAALPETLLESELYGYEKGAFTGADKKRPGKFQTADKGVLFLDEIGDMPLLLQAKILHVLQSGEFSPLGSDHDYKTDVWVIAATNYNLEECITNKTFREDLFYRLNVIKIDIPPLRERKEDILPLIEYYFRRYKLKYPDSQGSKPDSNTLEKLCKYPWPGNVRQLQNCIKKQIVLNSWKKVFEELPKNYPDISPYIQSDYQDNGVQPFMNHELLNDRTSIISEFIDLSSIGYDKLFEDISLKNIKKLASSRIEKEVITFVLNKVTWKKSKAAKILKISSKALHYKMKEFEVHPPIW